MKHKLIKVLLSFVALCLLQSQLVTATQVRIKDIARFDGVRDNALIGYGIVTGLSGTGDSSQNKNTLQSVQNVLQHFGVVVNTKDIRSRNVAAVTLTAQLPAFGQAGDKIDVTVSSIGDATSLAGGTLLMASLKAANEDIYALAQGILSVGGYRFESDNNVIQKNHPTVGRVIQGATLEKSIDNTFVNADGEIHILLGKPDFTTVSRMVTQLEREFPQLTVNADHAGRILLKAQDAKFPIHLLAEIENTLVNPSEVSRVVVNEKTGTIVSGTKVTIGDVVISHGSLKLTIETDYFASQPSGLILRNRNDGIKTEVLTDTTLSIQNVNEATFVSNKTTNIAELVDGLKTLKLSTREIISILEALKRSGALHAELVIQ